MNVPRFHWKCVPVLGLAVLYNTTHFQELCRSAVHMAGESSAPTPHFQVLWQLIFGILFDANRICEPSPIAVAYMSVIIIIIVMS